MSSEKVLNNMNKLHVCIFGGTTEGRLLSEILSKNNIKTDLFIATEYGQQFVNKLENVDVHQSRLDEKQMTELFLEKKYNFVVDATHPFAKIVTENIVKATSHCNIEYLRIIRESVEDMKCKYFGTVEECVLYLNDKKGNILLTTGSKDLDKFAKLNNYEERVFLRILPMESSLKRSIELGFSNKNIICMQGPFSQELNTAIINTIDAKYLVTKESSGTGGFKEKIESCIKTGIECLVIRKPDEIGLTLDEIINYFNIKR
nr:precorrin-6A reductase [Sedimentibacter sp.]